MDFEVGNVDFHILNDENANIKREPEESLDFNFEVVKM